MPSSPRAKNIKSSRASAARVLTETIQPLATAGTLRSIDTHAFVVERNYERIISPGIGYQFVLPMPDPSRQLLWAQISFPWQYWAWQGHVYNGSSSKQRYYGTSIWAWALTGHPSVFPDAQQIMGTDGVYEFYDNVNAHSGASFGPNAWLVEPTEKTFGPQTDASGTSIASLLQFEQNGVILAWIALELHQSVRSDDNGVLLGGYTVGPAGPDSLNLVYAYSGDRLVAPVLTGAVPATWGVREP